MKTKTLKRKTRTFLHLNAKCKTGIGIHRLGWFWASFKEAVSFLHWAPVFSSYWTCFKELIIPFGLPACGLLCLWLFGLKKEGGFQSSQEYTFGSSRTKRGLETEQSTQGEITELGGGFLQSLEAELFYTATEFRDLTQLGIPNFPETERRTPSSHR